MRLAACHAQAARRKLVPALESRGRSAPVPGKHVARFSPVGIARFAAAPHSKPRRKASRPGHSRAFTRHAPVFL